MIEHRLELSEERDRQIRDFAARRHIDVEQALALAVDLLVGEDEELRAWSLLSAEVLNEIWDNEADAIYDDWESLYGAPSE